MERYKRNENIWISQVDNDDLFLLLLFFYYLYISTHLINVVTMYFVSCGMMKINFLIILHWNISFWFLPSGLLLYLHVPGQGYRWSPICHKTKYLKFISQANKLFCKTFLSYFLGKYIFIGTWKVRFQFRILRLLYFVHQNMERLALGPPQTDTLLCLTWRDVYTPVWTSRLSSCPLSRPSPTATSWPCLRLMSGMVCLDSDKY